MKRSKGVVRVVRSAALVLVAGVASCGFSVNDSLLPLRAAKNLAEVDPGRFYRSAQLDGPELEAAVRELGLKTVINLRGENAGKAWYDEERTTLAALGVAQIDIRTGSREMFSREALLLLHDALLEAEYPMLVHCHTGADRSGATSAIYRILILGDEKADALDELSVRYGHFASLKPEMREMVELFEPRREWIEEAYPAPREAMD